MPDKILLADDSITIQKVVNLTFTDEGINVVTVGNGELAIKKLNEETFDLVLADIFMPGRNGYEVCEYVKSSGLHDIPVILLVGAFEPFDKAEASRVGADGHLTKPFESRILVETVKRMLAEAAARKAQAQAQAVIQAPPEPAQGGYRGQVVGWDVPTQKVFSPEEDSEPEPPPYDPYVSTAKLPPISQLAEPLPEPEPIEIPDSLSITHVAGSPPLPTGALFTPPGAEPPPQEPSNEAFHMDYTAQLPTEAPPEQVDTFPGFSFPTGSLPTEAPGLEPPVEAAPIAPVEPPRPQAPVAPGRDPLLETFADVADSTVRVDSRPDPEFISNQTPDSSPSMAVQPVEGLVSPWETAPHSPEPPPPEPEPVEDIGNTTMAYRVADIPAMTDVASEGSPFELPPDDSVVAPDAYDREGFSDKTEVYRLSDMPFSSVETVTPPTPPVSFDFPPVPEPEEPSGPLSMPTLAVPRARTNPLAAPISSTTQRLSMDEIQEALSEPPSAEPEPEPQVASAAEFELAVDEPTAAEESVGEVDLDYIVHPDAPAPVDAPSYVEAVDVDDDIHHEDTQPLPVASAEERAFITPIDEPEAEGPTVEHSYGFAEPEAAHEPAMPEPEAATVDAAAPAEDAVDVGAVVADESVQVAVPVAPVNGSGAQHVVDGSAGIPQELIEEVVRRTMERINDDVIREIAWEIIPDLAEQIIRKRLGGSQ